MIPGYNTGTLILQMVTIVLGVVGGAVCYFVPSAVVEQRLSGTSMVGTGPLISGPANSDSSSASLGGWVRCRGKCLRALRLVDLPLPAAACGCDSS